ncbi:adenylate cyclase [Haematococcus lacustris]|uniref:Adenylate cyclase n=1 Tax=Haematococcus lacustris TaxID=44745 RepID=A0A699YJN5_HAELA|nr:adenylate cyclase [Haematococcus lacustris]
MTSQAAVWNGYESAYEGDSYTIAFHTAQSAVQFALAVQKALLTVDWPLQLLDQVSTAAAWVRMGMHTGVHDPSDVARDAGTGRQRYSGAILAAAKAVQDCAQGGQLGSLALREDLVVMHAGQHVLKEGKAPEDLFNCFSRSLILRVAFLGPVR